MQKNALRCGISKREFLHSTLKDITMRIEGFKEEQEYRAQEIEYQSWLSGLFVRTAIVSALNKRCKYPKNPLDKEEEINIEEMTNAEIADVHEKFLKKLDAKAREAFGIKDKKEIQDG